MSNILHKIPVVAIGLLMWSTAAVANFEDDCNSLQSILPNPCSAVNATAAMLATYEPPNPFVTTTLNTVNVPATPTPAGSGTVEILPNTSGGTFQ